MKIQGANANDGFLTCTKQGIFRLQCSDMSTIPIPMYYTPDVDGTIVSPSAICLSPSNPYTIWTKTCDTQTGAGILTFKSRRHHEAHIDICMMNGLWFSYQKGHTGANILSDNVVRTLTAEAVYELWHQRLARPGEKNG